jgi:hypothetical protein
MKYTILIVVLLISAKTAFTQLRRPEYSRYTNGLLYEDTMLTRLKRIVNDRHTLYGTQSHTYYSVPQAVGRYISLKSDKAKEAIQDMHNNISVEDFVKKYPQTTIRDSNVLIVLRKWEYEGKKEFRYTLYPDSTMEDSYNHKYFSLNTDSADVMQKSSTGGISCRTGNWVYSYWKSDEDDGECLSALYLNTPLKRVALPERYAAWVRYADCLIDTTTSIFFPTAKDGFNYYYDGNKAGPKYEALRKDVNEDTGYSIIISYIGKKLKKQPAFKKLFTDAVKEALQLQYPTSFWFESAVEMYYSKQAALTLKRNRKVYVRCGVDQSDWLHMFDIAHMAAETANWPVFMHTHLNLMQIYPLRTGYSTGINLKSDGRPFIQELEMLDINVHDLFMGICLKVGDAGSNHFTASLQYICRFMLAAKYRDMFEQELLSMMADSELDDYNRLRMHYLFLNYLHFANDKDFQALFQKLKDADEKLPYYMHTPLKASLKGPLNLMNPD